MKTKRGENTNEIRKQIRERTSNLGGGGNNTNPLSNFKRVEQNQTKIN
jgi:hypothetical protein